MSGPRPDQRALLDEARALAEREAAGMLDLADAACVVTGGARGIGHAVGRRFALAGASTTLVDADPSVAAAAELLGAGSSGPVAAATCDVRDAEGLAAVARAATGDRRRLIWANCAGVFPSHPLEDLDAETWRDVVGIDLDGTYHGSRAAALAARQRGCTGVIINISSTAGSRAGWPPGIAHYVAAKHGVEGLTRALAVELGGDGLRVVCLAPGTVLTEGLVDRFGAPGGDDEGDDAYLRITRRMPVPRPALADDVARVALFCASEAAAMVTGCTIPVDGGHLAT